MRVMNRAGVLGLARWGYGELASKLHVNFVGVDTGTLEEF